MNLNLSCVASTSRPFDPTAAARVSKQFSIPIKAVTDLVCLSVDELRERDKFVAISNSMEPTNCPRFPVGSARICYWHNEVYESYVDFLRVFSARALVTSEAEGHIRQHRTFNRYVEMLKAGHVPPYIQVLENDRGALVSTNRRRTLVAQQVRRRITGWFSTINRATGFPLKYGDVLAAYAAACEPSV